MKNILFAVCMINACQLISCSFTGKHQISTKPDDIAKGEATFNRLCSGCHNFKQEAIGPQLSNITKEQSYNYLFSFIKNAENVIKAGDAHAVALHNYYKTTMPSFEMLNDSNINNIIAFLNTHLEQKIAEDSNAIKDPIPEKIKLSDLVISASHFVTVPASGDSGKTPVARITKLDYQPVTNKLFVVDLRGKLYKIEGNKAVVFMDIEKLKPNFINEPGLATGFGSFAFHPNFFHNGLLYTAHTEKPKSGKADFALPDSIKTTLQWVVTEWKADDVNAKVFKGKGRELFRIDMVTGIHGIQEICFNPLAKKTDEDYGLLYIGIGDGGAAENGYQFVVHTAEKPWGTIFRIDPSGNNSLNGSYGLPASNPFIKNKNGLAEVYAYGFRNPHRISWSSSGEMIVCNIGDSKIESINLIQKGNDYGWPVREGRFELHPAINLTNIYALPANDSSYHITYPVAEYDHDEGKAICGGFEYTGPSIPQLRGKFLFGDIPTGRLFYVDMKDLQQGKEATVYEWQVSINNKIQKLKDVCGNNRVDLHFGKDATGELYILTKADGNIYKIIAATLR